MASILFEAISSPILDELIQLKSEVSNTYRRLRLWCMEIVRQASDEPSSGSPDADAFLFVMDSNSYFANTYPEDGDNWTEVADALHLVAVACAGKCKPLLKTRMWSGYSTATEAVRGLTMSFGHIVTQLEEFREKHRIPFRKVGTKRIEGKNTVHSSYFEILDQDGNAIKTIKNPWDVEQELDDWFKTVFREWKELLVNPAKNILRKLGKKAIRKTKYKSERGTRIVTRHRFPEWDTQLGTEYNLGLSFLIQNWSVLQKGIKPAGEQCSPVTDESGIDGVVSIADIEPLTPYGYSKVATCSQSWGDKAQQGGGHTRHGWLYQTIRPILLTQFEDSTFPERYDDAMKLSKRQAELQNSDGTCRGSRKLRKLTNNSVQEAPSGRKVHTK